MIARRNHRGHAHSGKARKPQPSLLVFQVDETRCHVATASHGSHGIGTNCAQNANGLAFSTKRPNASNKGTARRLIEICSAAGDYIEDGQTRACLDDIEIALLRGVLKVRQGSSPSRWPLATTCSRLRVRAGTVRTQQQRRNMSTCTGDLPKQAVQTKPRAPRRQARRAQTRWRR
jgi:hypothetical protein